MVKGIKGSLTILAIFLILIMAMGMVQASQDTNFTLEDSEGEDMLADELSGSGKHFEDVQILIDNAEDGDEIMLEAGVYTPLNRDIENYDPININKSINITGISEKTIFNAQGMDGIFTVNSVNYAAFKNITFTGSIVLSAVSVRNSNVDFIDCIFDSNQGSDGGALRVYADERDSQINILNSSFRNNGAGMGAAGVGGAISMGQFDCTLIANIRNSYFSNNIAIRGGAIYVPGYLDKKSYLNIDNVTFEGNRLTLQDLDYVEISGCDIGFWGESNCSVNISNSNFIDDFDGENAYALSLLLLGYENNLINNTFLNTKLSFEKTEATFKSCDFKNVTFGLFNDPAEGYLYDSYSAAKSENLNYNMDNCSFQDSSIVVGDGIIQNSIFNNSIIYKNSQKELRIDNCSFKNQSKIKAYSNLEVTNSKFDDNSRIKMESISVGGKMSDLSAVTYNCAKKITIKVRDTFADELVTGLKLKINDLSTKKSYYITTDKNGCAVFVLDTKLSVGKHNLEITSEDMKYNLTKIKKTITVTKAKTTIKAPKVTGKYKKSKYFKVTVQDKSTKKVIKNVKVKIKVGKKVFNVKTNSKGIAQINTKSFKVGTHKVVISSGNSNYEMSAKSTIVIKR